MHLYEEYGEGMLAAAARHVRLRHLGSDRRRRLLLARDHFGQKPLFYTEAGGRVTFASEIKALLADDPSLAELSPRGARPVPHPAIRPAAGDILLADPVAATGALTWCGRMAARRIERYWDLSYGPKWTYGEAELLERIDALLDETVTAPPR